MFTIHLTMIAGAVIAATSITTPAPASLPPPVVVLAGTPSSVEKNCKTAICRNFDVYSDGRLTPVMISTLGLGDARIHVGSCAANAALSAATLLRFTANARGTRLCVCIPRSAFPVTGTATGKIIASSAPTSAEAAVVLNGSPPAADHFVAALLWGVGFAIPALFSTYLGQRVYIWQKRKDDERANTVSRREQFRNEPEAVQTFFNVFLPQLAGTSDEDFAGEIRNQYASIEGFLTNDDSVAMNEALDAKDRALIVAILRRNFPDRKAALESVESKG